MGRDLVAEYMADCRSLVLDELRQLVPSGRHASPGLYELIFDYPMREAKSLRPALCIAMCRALGGAIESVTPSAAVIELYHNAFLIHDDVEDGSELRRDAPALHRTHGVPVAVNVGDAMLALCLAPLLENMRLLSLGTALRILHIVARMARESAEGQALELSWIRSKHWSPTDRDYFRMVHKKTSHYTFVAPIAVGAVIGKASPSQLARLQLYATALGVAFQIQDDVLNLAGTEEALGKEIDGDLWEGKHTLLLIHALRSCSLAKRRHALEILQKPRPAWRSEPNGAEHLSELIDTLRQRGELSPGGYDVLRAAVQQERRASPHKTHEDVAFLKSLIIEHGSMQYASGVARRWAARARTAFDALSFLPASVHREFLQGVTDFVVERNH